MGVALQSGFLYAAVRKVSEDPSFRPSGLQCMGLAKTSTLRDLVAASAKQLQLIYLVQGTQTAGQGLVSRQPWREPAAGFPGLPAAGGAHSAVTSHPPPSPRSILLQHELTPEVTQTCT